MELSYTNEEQEFRQEVRAFLKEKLPPELARKVKESKIATRDDMMRWHKHPLREGLDRAGLAEGIWRRRLVDHPAPHL